MRPNYAWSPTGEKGTWTSGMPSRAMAIEEARKDLGAKATFFTCVFRPVTARRFSVQAGPVLDQVRAQAAEISIGPVSPAWPIAVGHSLEELERQLSRTLSDWLIRHAKPRFNEVAQVERHEPEGGRVRCAACNGNGHTRSGRCGPCRGQGSVWS